MYTQPLTHTRACVCRRATLLSRLVSTPLRRFIVAEWVYSSIDRGYFLRNEFQECLSEMGLPQVQPFPSCHLVNGGIVCV